MRPLIAAAALTLASVAAIGSLESQPRDAHIVAVVYPPWIGAERAIGRAVGAGTSLVRLGLLDTIVVVQDDAPDLADRLRASGAWAVLDPQVLGGCLAQGT